MTLDTLYWRCWADPAPHSTDACNRPNEASGNNLGLCRAHYQEIVGDGEAQDDE